MTAFVYYSIKRSHEGNTVSSHSPIMSAISVHQCSNFLLSPFVCLLDAIQSGSLLQRSSAWSQILLSNQSRTRPIRSIRQYNRSQSNFELPPFFHSYGTLNVLPTKKMKILGLADLPFHQYQATEH